jgi:carboxyl-terminal processing protease
MMRFDARRSLVSALAISATVLCSFPAMAAEQWGLPAEGNVTRGEFLRAAVQAMELPTTAEATLTGKYTRVPQALVPYVAAAEKRNNAIWAYDEDLQLGRYINRLDALELLVTLTRPLKEGVSDPYRDVRDQSLSADAVMHAVGKKWITPLRPAVFGGNRLLNAQEALALIKHASGNMPLRPTQTIEEGGENGTPSIKIDFRGSGQSGSIPNARVLDTVWQLIRSDYLYPDRVDEDKAMQKGIEEMVKSLDDPYSSYLPPASAEQFQTQIDGQVSGIGAQVEDRAGVLTIVTPLPGSPAQKAGLKPNDKIVKVDGVSIAGLSFLEAVGKVRGKQGSTVVLTIDRDGAQFEVTVLRDTVKVPEIDVSWQGSVAIVRLMQFGRLTDTELRGIMEEVQTQKPTGIILDLRNNPGGLLHAANTVLSNFLPKGSVTAIIRSRDGDMKDATEHEPTIDEDIPVVVLVNEGSASASEIVAGSLQDHGRARLVGTKTFGKGTVQEVIEFIDHSSLKLTIAEWFTPKDRKIDGLGLQPDIKVEFSQERDAQLLRALELLPGSR